MNFEIQSYEFYHIGIKLKSYVELSVLVSKLSKTLEEKGFEIIKNDKRVETLESIMGSLTGSRVETFATKNGVNVMANFGGGAIIVRSEAPENVDNILNVFEEILEYFPKINYDVDSTVAFFDIITNIIIDTDDAKTLLGKSIKMSSTTLDELNYNITPQGIRVSVFEKNETEDKDKFDIILGQFQINPKSLLLQFTFRSNNKKKINNIHNKRDEIIQQIIESMEGS
ncbi:MAG: hypothetical protein KJ906_02370 [Nanoarchaeota archaeon]|nr:hypothetical protein [Nanoarchaeota archaeon]